MPHTGPHGTYGHLPSTLERSARKAQDIYEKTLAQAEEEYQHDQARAHQVAWAAVKYSFEKVGDHWEVRKHRGKRKVK